MEHLTHRGVHGRHGSDMDRGILPNTCYTDMSQDHMSPVHMHVCDMSPVHLSDIFFLQVHVDLVLTIDPVALSSLSHF